MAKNEATQVYFFATTDADGEERFLSNGPTPLALVCTGDADDEERIARAKGVVVRRARIDRKEVRMVRFGVREDLGVLYSPPPRKPAEGAEAERLRCRCGEVLDGGARIGEGGIEDGPRRMPEVPGAFVICEYCGELSVLSEDMQLEVPTEKAFEGMGPEERAGLEAMARLALTFVRKARAEKASQ